MGCRLPARALVSPTSVLGQRQAILAAPPNPLPPCYLWGDWETLSEQAPSVPEVMEEYCGDKFTGTGRPSNFLGNDKASVATLCKISSFYPQVTCPGLFTWSLRVYLPFRQHHKPSKKSTQSGMCWVSCLSKMTVSSFFFLNKSFRCYVHSVNSSGSEWVGSQSSLGQTS